MSEIDNSDLIEYVIEFASDYLNNCKLFNSVYGRNFAKTKLRQNISSLYADKMRKFRCWIL